jgi:fibronectin-binding autotransporter adhesin
MLVPAGLLVNGTSIVQESGCKRVDYYHLELDTHDIILAERAPSESFVDDDNRGMFHNAHETGERQSAHHHAARKALPFSRDRIASNSYPLSTRGAQ